MNVFLKLSITCFVIAIVTLFVCFVVTTPGSEGTKAERRAGLVLLSSWAGFLVFAVIGVWLL